MELYYHKRIPECSMPDGGISNNYIDEKMVDLSSYFGGEIDIDATYYKNGINGATEKCFVRVGVAKKLERALDFLPDNLTFKVFDAWRPLSVQQEIYKGYYEVVKSQHNNWTDRQIESETVKFASKPNFDMQIPAVHSTGGAIDLTIAYKDSGEMLDMGTLFDEFTALSNTNSFENSSNEKVKENRRLLYWSMIRAGFTNLPSEWWHYDYGDRFWSYYKKQPALYCGIQSIEFMTKKGILKNT